MQLLGLGWAGEVLSPGYQANSANVFDLVFLRFGTCLSCDHKGNDTLSTENHGTDFATSRKVRAEVARLNSD